MSADDYNEILNQIQRLTPDKQLQLLKDLIAILRTGSSQTTAKPLHSIMELEGLGKEIWEGIDVEEYIRQERASWEK